MRWTPRKPAGDFEHDPLNHQRSVLACDPIFLVKPHSEPRQWAALNTNRLIKPLPTLFHMIHPGIWHLNDETMRATAPKPVFVHFCGGAERYTSCTELQFAPLKLFLKISPDHHTDTCVVVRMFSKHKIRFIAGLEERESGDTSNLGDAAVVVRT